MKTEQVYEGEWLSWARRGETLVCCDCGLAHSLEFRLKGNRIQMRMSVDRRATREERRKAACRTR